MTKNFSGGKGAKKRARKYVNNRNQTRQLIEKSQNQEYAKLIKALGCRRFTCLCSDGIERMTWIPGSLHWIRFRVDDYVLVSIRVELDSLKCDILHKYNSTEVQQLTEKKLIQKILQKEDRENNQNLLDLEVEVEVEDPKQDEPIEVGDSFFDDI